MQVMMCVCVVGGGGGGFDYCWGGIIPVLNLQVS